MAQNITYLCPRSPTFSVKIGDTLYRAQDGVLKLPESVAEALDQLMDDRPDIRTNLKKVDFDVAEAQVAAMRASAIPAAVQGPFASNNPAAAAVTAAKHAQMTSSLTGSTNPVNTIANPPADPVEVKEVKPGVSSGSILNKLSVN